MTSFSSPKPSKMESAITGCSSPIDEQIPYLTRIGSAERFFCRSCGHYLRDVHVDRYKETQDYENRLKELGDKKTFDKDTVLKNWNITGQQ